MNFALLADGRLLFICLLAGVVSMLTTLNVAARPAAVKTKQVALALAVSSIFFMFTRFANLFYLPILGSYVDKAVRTGSVEVLYDQIQWVVVGSALGALFSWLMLPSFVAIYERGIAGVHNRGSMFKVLLGLPTVRGIKALWGCWRSPLQLNGWTKGSRQVGGPFLFWNVCATAIWTVGALCALYVSAAVPHLEATAVLLSGLVNSFAAIAFAIFVDPKAAVITDQAVQGERPVQDVNAMTFWLGAGNCIGGILGLAVFPIGIAMIRWATLKLGATSMSENMWLVIGLNMLTAVLMLTALSSRVSAVITKKVATSLAIYNVFFLITRLATQVFAPILGAVRDSVMNGNASADELLPLFRWVVWAATAGTILGWLLIPTFVEIYNQAIIALENRGGAMAQLLKDLLRPRNWMRVLKCWRPPSLLQVKRGDLASMPKNFLMANMLVVGIHVIGVLSAILAGAQLSGQLARTATLLSSIINGVATILGSVLVDPTAAHITDQCVHGKRPDHHIHIMVVWLAATTLIGTLLSQVLLQPSSQLIVLCAKLLDWLFHAL